MRGFASTVMATLESAVWVISGWNVVETDLGKKVNLHRTRPARVCDPLKESIESKLWHEAGMAGNNIKLVEVDWEGTYHGVTK